MFNPVKAGGRSEYLRIAWGEGRPEPPLEKGLIRIGIARVEVNVNSPIFQSQLIEKKLDR